VLRLHNQQHSKRHVCESGFNASSCIQVGLQFCLLLKLRLQLQHLSSPGKAQQPTMEPEVHGVEATQAFPH
jgi:hypothetical protein